MKMILFAVIFFLSNSAIAGNEKLNPFVTDYCTNYPEGTQDQPELWKHCCLMHDLYFWAGGSKSDRIESDKELMACIEQTGALQISRIVYFAVRAGSYSPIKYPKKKWGNGWEGREEFAPLTSLQLQMIETEIYLDYEDISAQQKQHFIFQLRSREN